MRIRSALFTCLMLAVAAPSTSVFAQTGISEQDVVARVMSAGFGLVSRAEPESASIWDVWASKDGVPYEVKVNAKDGSVIQATPAGGND